MKPKVFIGSSQESLLIANAIQNNLDYNAEVTLWTQDIFKASEFILESLLKELDRADFGIFIFSPDDIIAIRGTKQQIVRDNVIFEFGIFVGHLGRSKCIIVAPREINFRIPTDLLGLNYLLYSSDRQDGNLDAALGPVCNKISALFAKFAPNFSSIPEELSLNFAERRDTLSLKQRAILGEIEKVSFIVFEDLSKLFKQIPLNELVYRLEQLRLLMFISQQLSQDSIQKISYCLSDTYAKVFKKRKISPGTSSLNINDIK